jgi:hypothetical protein
MGMMAIGYRLAASIAYQSAARSQNSPQNRFFVYRPSGLAALLPGNIAHHARSSRLPDGRRDPAQSETILSRPLSLVIP